MKVRQLPYADHNSPGMLEDDRAERDHEGPLEDIEISDDAPPGVLDHARRHGYRPAFPEVLPPARFSDARATAEQRRMVNAPTTASETGPNSRSIRMRLACSCAGWNEPPTSDEFHAAVRAKTPTERQRAILESWSNEAEDIEVLDGWTEDAYTLRQLAAALQRAGIGRCAIAEALNRLSM